jgi:LysR family hydrogen peroxide-inducible transcriptional activator
MEMHQIRYFLAVCRTLNFTKAAEECNVAQPSLTRAVQKLEEELGGPLFHRERANTHLTELGRLMMPHLEQTLSAAQAAKSLATSVRKGQVAPLRLVVDHSVPMKPVIGILSALRESIKGIELTLGAGTRQEVLDDILDGDFDLVIAGQTANPDDRIRSWVLFREQCRIVVPHGHAFAAAQNIALAELDGVSMIQRMECCLHDKFHEACSAKGVAPIVRHCAASEEQLQQMILAGFGLGICSPSLELAAGLVAVPFANEDMDRDIVLATVAGRRFSAATDAFVKIARARDWSAAS